MGGEAEQTSSYCSSFVLSKTTLSLGSVRDVDNTHFEFEQSEKHTY